MPSGDDSSSTHHALPSFRSLNLRADSDGSGTESARFRPTTSERRATDAHQSLLATTFSNAPRTASFATGNAPGSFSTNLILTKPDLQPSNASIRPGPYPYIHGDRSDSDMSASARRQEDYRKLINKEIKMRIGSENLLEALLAKPAKQTKDQRIKVENELIASNRKIAELRAQLQEEVNKSRLGAQPPPTPSRNRFSFAFASSTAAARAGAILGEGVDDDIQEEPEEREEPAQSPTFVLGEVLQALEVEGLTPDYYISKANDLVELFAKHDGLKHDLAWSIFGLRLQTMLLSESRKVVAAGYRLLRYVISTRESLVKIRGLHTDELVVLSLTKDYKASVEREQAFKFIRAFVDVKDGALEISNSVVRAVVAVAEQHEDRLRNLALLTLTEILLRHPGLVVGAGGLVVLANALRDGTIPGSETLALTLIQLCDKPSTRAILGPSSELDGPFGMFADPLFGHSRDDRLKVNGRAISTILSSWTGLFVLAQSEFTSISSLFLSLDQHHPVQQDAVLEIVFDTLHIKPPSWASSFLAGRRLTTYGRVTNMRSAEVHEPTEIDEADEDGTSANLIDHYTSLLLVLYIRGGLVKALIGLINESDEPSLAKKATVLLAEVIKLGNYCLPSAVMSKLIPDSRFGVEHLNVFEKQNEFKRQNMIYQIDSVIKTMGRSSGRERGASLSFQTLEAAATASEQSKRSETKLNMDMDEIHFRSLLLETQVVNSSNYSKWHWDLIVDIIEGPLQSPKNFDLAARSTKFLKRLMGFFRPFKFRFADIRNSKPNQRYVRAGCALIKGLLKTQEGQGYLNENKLLPQIAECLAQLDRTSGITSSAPMFSKERMEETMTHGYFDLIGAFTTEAAGLSMLVRRRMINMFYYVIELEDRTDVVEALLGSLDYTIDSHLRVILSKAMTVAGKDVRIFATKLLTKYATLPPTVERKGSNARTAFWAIRLLIGQLYDPEVEVGQVAVEILQESCRYIEYLEFVIHCRPVLDHLGEIGAPLLLRFLSSSLGYQYLNKLDYITQEMDDWFLGRNEKYVAVVEAMLFKISISSDDKNGNGQPHGDVSTPQQPLGMVPPHFYRVLSKTKDGCQLLKQSGHFNEFVSTIRDYRHDDGDSEAILQVKACLWAVGNIGSVDYGAEFLDGSEVVAAIIKIVESADVISVRGTAFFTLGLLSRSTHGLEILYEHGWDAAVDFRGRSMGFILPNDLRRLFKSKPQRRGWKKLTPNTTLRQMHPPRSSTDTFEKKLYQAVISAGNTVLIPRALNEINVIKTKRSELFRSTQIFRNVLYIFECHSIKLPVRQRVVDLFDKSVIRKIVLDESSDEEIEDESRVRRRDDGNNDAAGRFNLPFREASRDAARGDRDTRTTGDDDNETHDNNDSDESGESEDYTGGRYDSDDDELKDSQPSTARPSIST